MGCGGRSGLAQAVQRKRASRLPAEQRVADIMEAARAIFITKGYEDALISDIAERAGVVEGSIYRFFTNKRELLVRVIERWYEDMLAEDDAQFAGVRGTWNRIRFIVHHHLMSIRREPALSRLVFTELRPDPNYRDTRLYQLNQAYTHRIIEVVREAVASGEFHADVSVPLVRDMIYGCIEHRTWAFLRDEGDFDTEATADGITDILYRGLVAKQAEPNDMAALAARLEAAADRLEKLSGQTG